MLNKIVKSQTLNTCFLGCVQVQQNSEEHDAAGLPEQGVQLYNTVRCKGNCQLREISYSYALQTQTQAHN